jgi:hypothetical protein
MIATKKTIEVQDSYLLLYQQKYNEDGKKLFETEKLPYRIFCDDDNCLIDLRILFEDPGELNFFAPKLRQIFIDALRQNADYVWFRLA